MKKLLSFLITLSLILSYMPLVPVAAAELSWPELASLTTTDGEFRPHDNCITTRNPPAFTWPTIPDAVGYELIVSSDREQNDVLYKVVVEKDPYYNFPLTFEKSKVYFWSVRYITKDGKYSEPSDVMRFLIDDDAVDFTLFPMEELEEHLPKQHPYYKVDWERYQDLPIKGTIINLANSYLNKQIPTDDTVVNNWYNAGYNCYIYAMAYKLTGDAKYFEAANKVVNTVLNWNTNAIEWTASTDMHEAYSVLRIATAYDWLFNDFTESQKSKWLMLIENLMKRPILYWAAGVDSFANRQYTLHRYPNSGHELRLNDILATAVIIHKESKGVKLDLPSGVPNVTTAVKMSDNGVVDMIDFIKYHLPFAVAYDAYLGYEDGSSGAGPKYSSTDGHSEQFFALRQMGLIDIFQTPYFRNQMYNFLYLYPEDWDNTIGDSYGKPLSDSSSAIEKTFLQTSIYTSQNKTMQAVNKWLFKNVNAGNIGNHYDLSKLSSFITSDFPDVEEKPPVMLPSAKMFPDSGWSAMYNQLSNVPERVGMIFISSPSGSSGHSHPHQNSFVIQAYGEYLAIDSDYYDAMGSPFDVAYNRNTFAHNSVTFDGGSGQKVNNRWAKGHITEFLNGTKMNLSGGEAKDTYSNPIEKFDRRIIYIKPETFIVIDDLAAKDDRSWEWWINTYGDMKLYEEGNGVMVTEGNVTLDTEIHFPENIDANYINYFAGPDLSKAPDFKITESTVPIRFRSDPRKATDKRMYFATDKTEATKIITTLDVNKKENGRKYIKSEQIGNVLKLSFEDGTIAYIKTDDAETMTINYYETDADAIVEQDETYMMVDGTYLKYGDLTLVSSDINCSVMMGNGELSVSSIDNDANVKIYAPYIEKLTRIRNENALEVIDGVDYGSFKYTKEEGYLNFHLYPGHLYFYINDKALPGSETDVSLTLDIDNVISTHNIKGTLDVNGDIYTEYKADVVDGIYVYNGSNGIQIDAKPGDIKIFSDIAFPIISDDAYLNLETVSDKGTEIEYSEDFMKDYNNVAVSRKADLFDSINATYGIYPRDWAQGNTLQQVNDTEESVTYMLDVPEAGYYDIVVGYSTSLGSNVRRIYKLDNNVSEITLKATSNFNNLDQARIKTKMYLEKGTHELTFMAITSGECILTWVGLLNSEI